jgi:hypothetical protein
VAVRADREIREGRERWRRVGRRVGRIGRIGRRVSGRDRVVLAGVARDARVRRARIRAFPTCRRG